MGTATAIPAYAVGRALLVDDNELHVELLARTLRQRGYEVLVTSVSSEAVGLYQREQPEVVVCDLTMPGLDGIEVLARLRQADPSAAVILLSGFLDVPTTVKALRLGAEDVLTKPFETPQLLSAMEAAIERVRGVQLQRAASRQSVDAMMLLGESSTMQRLHRALQQAALGTYPILLHGERGTAKSAAAHLIHRLSPRTNGPFVRVRCADFAAVRPERELFGAESATDTPRAPRGLFQSAEGGTLYFDEIAALPISVQPLLVKTLERFAKSRGERDHRSLAGVRVIGASSQSLEDAVDGGTLLRDLHYAMAAVPITIPPIRSRGTDSLAALATQLLQLHQARIGRGPTRFSDAALARLTTYRWPGNVRELRSVLERSFPYALDSATIEEQHLPPELHSVAASAIELYPSADASTRTLESVERRHIARVLSETGGNRSRAAKILGVSRGTLYNKIAAFNLDDIGYDD